jgi:hypothetical protein
VVGHPDQSSGGYHGSTWIQVQAEEILGVFSSGYQAGARFLIAASTL